MELKKCPFCGSAKIKLSIQRKATIKNCHHNICYYCVNCNAYGPRIIYKSKESENIYLYEDILPQEIKDQVTTIWNKRGE